MTSILPCCPSCSFGTLETAAGAEEITAALLVVEDEQELADEITAGLRALRPSGPASRR